MYTDKIDKKNSSARRKIVSSEELYIQAFLGDINVLI